MLAHYKGNVAIVHDWFSGEFTGGSEKVFREILMLYPIPLQSTTSSVGDFSINLPLICVIIITNLFFSRLSIYY